MNIMEKYQVEADKAKMQLSSGALKLVLILIGLSIVGALVCGLLAVLRIAVETMVIVAGVLVVLVLIGIVIYTTARYKISEGKYDRQLKRLKQSEENSNRES